MQSPCPEQRMGHANRSHARPSNPSKQVHSPVPRSQIPWSEHSRRECAALVALGTDVQLLPAGHTRFEHAGCLKSDTSVGAPQPSWHVHRFVDASNVPWSLHDVSQSEFWPRPPLSRSSSAASDRNIDSAPPFIDL